MTKKFPLCEKYIKKKDMLYLENQEWEVIELALSKAERECMRPNSITMDIKEFEGVRKHERQQGKLEDKRELVGEFSLWAIKVFRNRESCEDAYWKGINDCQKWLKSQLSKDVHSCYPGHNCKEEVD